MNRCPKCGAEEFPNANYCLICGNKLNGNIDNIETSESNNKKIKILEAFGIVFAITIFLLVGLAFYNSNKKLNGNFKTRTIMLYVVGSNLESKGGILTADLASLDPNEIDLTKFNILLYTGGTTEWNNEYIKNDQNGLYKYTKNGFELIEAQSQLNMGNASTLSSFLSYAYENYPADAYDLVFWDHGGALDGALYDDFTNDNLSLVDMKEALEKSPFNKNNKLQTMLFRTCLNATLEVANVYKDYANYLIASEETSYGMSNSSVLNYMNVLKVNDSGKDYGIKFVNAYKSQMSDIDPNNTLTHTYSVIDLSKIDEITNLLDEYVSGINLENSYKELSQIRSDLYQYAETAPSYDTVDLYQFIESTKKLSTVSSDKLLKAIDEAVLDNYNNDNYSKGISVYFPYNGTTVNKQKYLSVYSDIGLNTKYLTFIANFYKLQQNPVDYSYNLYLNNEKIIDDYKTSFSLKLTDEQVQNYASCQFALFKRDKEHPKYFKLLLISKRATLKDNILTANYKNDLIVYTNPETEQKTYIYNVYTTNGKTTRYSFASFYDSSFSFSDHMDDIYDVEIDDYYLGGTLYYSSLTGIPVIGSARLKSDNERIDGSLIDLNKYNSISIYDVKYKLLDDNNNFILDNTKWETSPYLDGVSFDVNNPNLSFSNLDDDSDYYGLFIVRDIYGNANFSTLIRLVD